MIGHMEKVLFVLDTKKNSKNLGEDFLGQRVANYGPQAKSSLLDLND